MDAVAGLLDGPRARGAFLLRSVLDPPWSMRIEDEAPLTLVAVVRGTACVAPGDGAAVRLGAGDVAILRGPDPYVVADDPATAPQAVILPGQRCVLPDGQELTELYDLGIRTWGNSPDGETMMVTGTYQWRSETSQRLLDALPAHLVVAADSWEKPLIGFLGGGETRRWASGGEGPPGAGPAGGGVRAGLLALLLLAVLRGWSAREEAAAP